MTKTLWNKIKQWLPVSQRQHNAGMRFLSADVIGNRIRLSEQRGMIRELQQRVWELEGHTPEETMEEIDSKMSEWQAEVEEITNDN